MLPAYAGMIRREGSSKGERVCAPRVCGDDPEALVGILGAAFVLPAYAGMIPKKRVTNALAYSAPRVCGDDPRMLSCSMLA